MVEDQANHREVEYLTTLLKTRRNIIQLITNEKDPAHLIKSICDNLISTNGYRYAWIALFDDSCQAYEVAEAGLGDKFGTTREKLVSGQCHYCYNKILYESDMMTLEDSCHECSNWKTLNTNKGYRILMTRLEHEGRMYGMMSVCLPLEHLNNREEQGLIRELAKDIAFALHNIEKETEFRQMQDELRENDERFRVIFNSTHDLIAVANRNGRLIWSNPAWQKKIGLVLDHQDNPFFRSHPDDRQKMCTTWSDMLKGMAEINNLEYRHLKLDGDYAFLKVCAIRVVIAREPYIYIIAHDITRRKQDEEILRNSNETINGILRAAPIGIGMAHKRIIMEVNDRICQMTGYTRDELIGQSARMLYPGDEDYAYVGRVKYAQMAKHRVGMVETRWLRKDSEIRDILLSSTYVSSSNTQNMVVFTALDITDRKKQHQIGVELLPENR